MAHIDGNEPLGKFDSRYLKLDASNDPLTGVLDLASGLDFNNANNKINIAGNAASGLTIGSGTVVLSTYDTTTDNETIWHNVDTIIKADKKLLFSPT